MSLYSNTPASRFRLLARLADALGWKGLASLLRVGSQGARTAQPGAYARYRAGRSRRSHYRRRPTAARRRRMRVRRR